MNRTGSGDDTELDHKMELEPEPESELESGSDLVRDLDRDCDPDLHHRKQVTGGMARNNDHLSKCLPKVIFRENCPENDQAPCDK